MVNEIIQGKIYHLPFIAPYESKGPYDVEVTAVTRKATLDVYGDFDIRGTFFDEVGIKTYLTMVDDDTDIFICHPISSYDPVEIDLGTNIFIPKSIIDYSNSDEYQEMTRYQFTIEGVRRHFDKSYEAKNFIKELENTIPSALANGTILANDVLSISNIQEELLVTKTVIDKEEKERDRYIKEREEQLANLKKQEMEREMEYYRRLKNLEQREKIVAEKEKIIDDNVKLSETNKQTSNAFLKVTNDMVERIHEVYLSIVNNKDGTLPAWNELYSYIVYGSAQDQISLTEWKDAVTEYTKKGFWPNSFLELIKKFDKTHCPYCERELDIQINSE